MTPLTPEEASAAADCVAAILEDYADLDPACPLMVWAGPVRVNHMAGDANFHRAVNERATQARVAAARAALVHLREVACGGEERETPLEWRSLPHPPAEYGRVWHDGKTGETWYLCRQDMPWEPG